MTIGEHSVEAAKLIEVAGRVDSTTAASLEATLLPGLTASTAVILDLSGVVYVSSAGLRVLLKAAKLARSTGHRLLLTGLAPQVREVFEISGCAGLFSIYADRPSATAASRLAA